MSSRDASPPTLDSVIKHPPGELNQADPEKSNGSGAEPSEPYTAYSRSRQLCIILIVTAAGFFAPLTGAVYLPSLILFENIFNTTAPVINASVSIYWAIFGIAPLFGATISDYGGRKTIYIMSLAVFLISNGLLAALPPTLGGLFTLRIFQVRFTVSQFSPIIITVYVRKYTILSVSNVKTHILLCDILFVDVYAYSH